MPNNIVAGHKGPPSGVLHFLVDAESSGQRLDLFLVRQDLPVDITRSKLQGLIRSGLVSVNDRQCKTGYRVQGKDLVSLRIPPPEPSSLAPEDIFFRCIYEDDYLVVVSKPPGLVVHPSCGHSSGTLVHGLLFHCRDLSVGTGEQRPGIVHRLDKDTSGIMVVAKNDGIHHALMKQFKQRQVEKIYLAILDGRMSPQTGRIDKPIGRHPINRKKMAIRPDEGRRAATSWKVLEEFTSFSYVQLHLETGRTHQIRVHMAFLGHPVAGDQVYGSNKKGYREMGIVRQCLHAHKLSFMHPSTKEHLHFTAPLWDDMADVLDILRAEKGV